MARVIVTGGSGFLGHHLCRALLAAGHTVKNIDLRPNPEVDTVIADICDTERMLVEIRDADVVFHLAALIEAGESVKFPQKFVDVNISGTVSVLEAMRQNQVPTFIFSSSAAVYGEPLRVPILEDDRTLPINPYGMTKLAMEALVSSYVASYKMTGIGLRYFNLYGPEEHHQPESHAIPRFIEQIQSGQEVTVWGNGQHQRDFIYITDVVEAHLQSLNLAQQQPQKYHYLNLSTNHPTEVRQVIQMLEQLMGKKANVRNFPERPGDPLVLVADSSKATQVLGWTARTQIEEGLKKTVEYFLSKQT
ncbi:NAD-dependent epimerase/dehydratase family protein [Patescibacteria group bacterium]|nr:NAD-dependent epimerase/dehydratase family protein [Patescibacteria group bacterium]